MKLQQIAFSFDDLPPVQEPVKKTIVKKPKAAASPKPVKEPDPVVPAVKSTRGRKSLKEAAAHSIHVNVPEDEVLFQKMYYPIGAVAEMFQVNQSLLRYWENEFDILKPKKNGKGDRLFRPEDIKNLLLIHNLLRERKFTIDGARDYLKRARKAEEKFAAAEQLKKIREFLVELKAQL